MSVDVPLPPPELRMGGDHFLADDDFRAAARSDVRYLVDHCGLVPTSSVLDVGCGPGRLAIGLVAELGGIARYVGVDVQARHIDWCQEHLAVPGLAFVLNDAPNDRYNPGGADGFTLPEDELFDVIHAYSLLSHMRSSDVATYLRAFRHHLADDGHVFLTAFVEPDVPREEENPVDYGTIAWSKPLHCVRYEEGYFYTLISQAGLAVERCDSGTATDGQSAFVLSARGGRGAVARREMREIGEQLLGEREIVGYQQRCGSLEAQRADLLAQLERQRQKLERLTLKRAERDAVVHDLRARARTSRKAIRLRDRTIRELEERLQAAEQTLGRRPVRTVVKLSNAVPRRARSGVPDRDRKVEDSESPTDSVPGRSVDDPVSATTSVEQSDETSVETPNETRTVEGSLVIDPNELVVYSALVQGYDELPSVAEFENSAIRFVCFADVVPTDSRGWEILPLDYYSNDPKRSVLFLKTHPHVYFPDKRFSLWCDASTRMSRSPLDLIQAWGLGDADIASFLHSDRDCVYEEAAEVIDLQLDVPSLVEEQMLRYESEGYPRHRGLHETNLLFRRHNAPDVVRFDQQWWSELEAGSRRDQLSFDVVAWRLEIPVHPFAPHGWSARNYPGLDKRKHLAERTFRRPRNSEKAALERRALNVVNERVRGVEPHATDGDAEDMDIVIPVHDALAHVQRCIRSVQSDPEWAGRLVIVDDGSREPTRRWCQGAADGDPRIQLVRHDDARGFPGACNAGLSLARSRCVAVLNSDTVVPPGWLTKMCRVIDSSPSIGIVGPLSNAASWQSVPRVRSDDGSLAVNSLPAGVSVDDMNAFLEEVARPLVTPLVPTLNGFCLVLRREVVDRLGGFDEVAFPRGYGEEVDLTLRATEAGYLCAIALDTYVFHAKSQSFGARERDELKISARNTLVERYGDERLNRIAASTRQHPALEFVRDAVARLFEFASAAHDGPTPPVADLERSSRDRLLS